MMINPCSHQPCKIKEKIKTRYNTESCHDHCMFHKMYKNHIKKPNQQYIGIADNAYTKRERNIMRNGSSRSKFARKRGRTI